MSRLPGKRARPVLRGPRRSNAPRLPDWRPFYYLLEADFQVLLVNAREVKNVPGRKSDVSDAAWLADLGAHGLLRASFVPPEPIRQLRDLTRTRTHITAERTSEVQRLEKLLESAGIKLSSVATDITGMSGRLMLQALIHSQGTAEPARIAGLAKRRMRLISGQTALGGWCFSRCGGPGFHDHSGEDGPVMLGRGCRGES